MLALLGEGFVGPSVEDPGESDEFGELPVGVVRPMAFAWNRANGCSGVGFTAKTMPFWQWSTGLRIHLNHQLSLILGERTDLVCLQKNHRGPVKAPSVSDWEAMPLPVTELKPVDKPFGTGVHGLSKVD